MDTVIYYADTTPLRNESLLREALRLLPPQRLQKIARCRVGSDKALSAGAGLLLRKALLEMHPDGPSVTEQLRSGALSVSYGEYGKPYLQGISGFCFSISHSGNFAALAVSDTEIGCDLEQIRQANLRVAARFFSESENALLSRVSSEEERNILFYRLWTLRESFVKALGRGLSLSMRDFAVEPEGVLPGIDRTRVIRNGDERTYSFSEPFIAADYRLAVCRTGESCCPTLCPVDFQ